MFIIRVLFLMFSYLSVFDKNMMHFFFLSRDTFLIGLGRFFDGSRQRRRRFLCLAQSSSAAMRSRLFGFRERRTLGKKKQRLTCEFLGLDRCVVSLFSLTFTPHVSSVGEVRGGGRFPHIEVLFSKFIASMTLRSLLR